MSSCTSDDILILNGHHSNLEVTRIEQTSQNVCMQLKRQYSYNTLLNFGFVAFTYRTQYAHRPKDRDSYAGTNCGQIDAPLFLGW